MQIFAVVMWGTSIERVILEKPLKTIAKFGTKRHCATFDSQIV